MSDSAEEAKRIHTAQEVLRSGAVNGLSLCQYKDISCVRCCLPHIGGDSHMEDSEEERSALLRQPALAYHIKYSGRYLGPGGILMKFRNFNPLKDPKIEASQYEDSLPDVGKKEMDRRFAERRNLFLEIYDPKQPKQSLPQYMKAAQKNEGYKYKPAAHSGPASLFLAGLVPRRAQQGELPECQLLGFVDEKRRVGCMAHPLAETSRGFDGRDLVGFFDHTGCCNRVSCEASKEFRFLSAAALKVFDKAVQGMSWYDYSRHATSVFVYYLRCYDHLLQKLDERERLDTLALDQLVELTNNLYDEWPLRNPDALQESQDPKPMDWLHILSIGAPLSERIMYIALGTRFIEDPAAAQLQQARDHVEKRMAALRIMPQAFRFGGPKDR